jgi:hypothetical protein
MFDDPVIPMALFRTGPRATAELSCLAALLILWWVIPSTIIPPEVFAVLVLACAMVIALLGARKTWWSIGDLINFSGISALRGKIEFGRQEPLPILTRILLTVADPLICLFMQSGTVKTVLVDRRPGEESSQSRLHAITRMIEVAASGEQIWVFFEGGRSRKPDEIGPARKGIGHVVKGLQSLGIRPIIIAIHHRGLEHVIPMSSRHWVTSGGRIDVRWSEFCLEGDEAHGVYDPDAQKIADDIRGAVLRLQSVWRSGHSTNV